MLLAMQHLLTMMRTTAVKMLYCREDALYVGAPCLLHHDVFERDAIVIHYPSNT
jgi:hypothetical protein